MLLSARIFSKVATIIVIIFIARGLGSDAFGIYSGVIALTVFAGLISDFGLILPTIRRISYDEHQQNVYIGETVAVRLLWGGVAFVVIVIVGEILGFPFALVSLFAVSFILETLATSLVRAFEGRQKMKIVTLYTVAERCCFCLCVLLAVWHDKQIVSISAAYLVSSTAMFYFSLHIFQRNFGKLTLRFSPEIFRRLSVLGFPFFMTAIFSAIYYRTDTLLLSIYRSNTDVGMYNASMRVIDAQMFIPMTIMATLYPVLSRFHFQEASEFVKVFRRSLITFSILGIAIALFLYAGSSFIINVLYSASYYDATPALQVLALSLIFYFLNFLLSQTLIAINKETSFTVVMAGSAILNIVSNLALIPSYGIIGAAWSRVCVESLMTLSLGSLLYYHFRHTPMKYKNTFSMQELERVP